MRADRQWETSMRRRIAREAHAEALFAIELAIAHWPASPERDRLYAELVAPLLHERLMRIAALGLDTQNLKPAEAASKILVACIKKIC